MTLQAIRNRGAMTPATLLSWDQNGIVPGDAIDFSVLFTVGAVKARAFHWLRDSTGQSFDRLSRVQTPPLLNGTAISTLISSTRHEPLEIRFEKDNGDVAAVHGAGTDILSGTNGLFTAVVRVYDGKDQLLLKAEARSNPNGDSVFLGIRSTKKEIAKITIDLKTIDQQGLRINDVSVVL